MNQAPAAERVEHVAVQMYTLRHLFMPLGDASMSLDEVLREVAAAGYTGIETFGPLEPPAAELRALLDKHGLQVCSAHVALESMESDLDAVIAYHKALDNDTLIVPWLHPDKRPQDAAGWAAFGRRLGELGARAAAQGMRLLYHNHDFEMAATNDETALDALLAAAEPEHLGAEIDIAWVIRGGQDPLALLQRLAGRVPYLHVKDVAPEGENLDEGGHADVGAGTVEWDTILPAARAAGVEWLVVEHDEPHYPLQTLGAGAAYLRGRWE
jgi:sugar phosphate isomerase/epimerase